MKYIIEFQKTGVVCFTSHLDIIRVFKRAFKRANIKLAYSQGFNPHPKMGFAQPLSLGYEGLQEYIEFETVENHVTTKKNDEEILNALRSMMPEGINLVSIKQVPDLKKTLASLTEAAHYEIIMRFPKKIEVTESAIYREYMGREKIMVLKRQKKKNEKLLVDIKPKIRELRLSAEGNILTIDTLLDSGSESNLSPELIIESMQEVLNVQVPRCDISVTRKALQFKRL